MRLPSGGGNRGLSPRVRGNPSRGRRFTAPARSIPAGAGEPVALKYDGCGVQVYPRGCGGTAVGGTGVGVGVGLSPRVRGNHCRRYVVLGESRSIPAGAGEPVDLEK